MKPKKYHLVYMTTCEETGRFYIGKHSTNNKYDGYKGSGVWVKRALRSGRKLNTVIMGCFKTEQEAFDSEIEYIAALRLDCPDKIMNFADGGLGGISGYLSGKPLSESHKKSLSESRMGMKFSDKHKENLSKAKKGRPISESVKKKISFKFSRWVVCLLTGEVFRGTREAAKFWGISNSTVSAICRGKYSGSKYKFEYMDQ